MISPSKDIGKTIVVNKMLSYDNETEELEDPFLNVRVMAIDSNFYKGLRDQLYKTFQSGAARILYEMGLGYGAIMGKIIEEQGKGRLQYYKDFVDRGKYHAGATFKYQCSKQSSLVSKARRSSGSSEASLLRPLGKLG